MKNNATPDKAIEIDDRWRQFNWVMHLLIAFTGLIVVVLVSYGFYLGTMLYKKYFPLADASMEMRLEATTAYLWFEEMLGGDESKNIEDILAHLDKADWYADAIIAGGENRHLKLLPLEEMEIHESTKKLKLLLSLQRDLLNKRIGDRDSSGPGTVIDKLYHETLEEFVDKAKALEMDAKRIMIEYYETLHLIWIGVICGCVFLFLIIGYRFHRYEKRRRKNYLEKLEMQRILVQNEKLAAMGKMIINIAHEINNPNNFIFFNTPILKEYLQEITPILDEYVDKNPDVKLMNMSYEEFIEDLGKLIANIESGSKRINGIVSELQVFSRNKDKANRQWFDIREAIDKAVAICGPNINELVDSFERNIQDELPKAYCDPEIVELILVNFLVNASEAVDKKNSRVRLDVYLENKKKDSIIVAVTDNGCGIEDSIIDSIFDPFFTTKSSNSSTGMGLYLSQILADQIGARIEVVSKAGQGSTFKLITKQESGIQR